MNADDHHFLLLKVATGSEPTEFRREYSLAQSLDAPGIFRPRTLLADGDQLAMVLDDAPLVSLETMMAREPVPVQACLQIALSTASALGRLHAAGLLHGDLRPANLLVDSDTHEVLIADISAAVERGEPPAAVNDWAYVSPEQTGRINRSIDHRTDFYALGVLLYRLLTGRLPFQASDGLEWVHCHIARTPPSPAAVAPHVPRMVSDLAMKLLVKEAEKRYQSAYGLQEDLQCCLRQWQAAGAIEHFELGANDASEQLQIPEKLYGRESERSALLEAFGRVRSSERPEVVLVQGYAGIGKTSLVLELRGPLISAGGHIASGSFDPHRGDVPYSALSGAVTELMRQILSEPEERVHEWRASIQAVLGRNGRLIVDLIPSVELLIGPQPDFPELDPSESENRLRIVFRDFIGAFSSREHPLVFFLDNLQWADAASLALLQEFVTHPDIRGLLIVGSHREDETDGSHPLTLMLERARRMNASISRIALRPLRGSDVAALVADALHCSLSQARPLANLVQAKTGGNPFFVIQFLGELHAERLLAFDPTRRQWQWDLGTIAAKGITDNVVELMVRKLRRLPPATAFVVECAACLGSEGEISKLVGALGRTEREVRAALHEAARSGLVVCREDTFKFAHDRIQEAAYGLMVESERPQRHLQIGRALMSRLNESELERDIFDVVGQLNRGASFITEPREKVRLGKLNKLAGRKARRGVAYAAAYDHLRRAAELLPADAWETEPDDTCALWLELAECAYLVGDIERSQEVIELVLVRSDSELHLARAWRVRLRLYLLLGRFVEAIQAALEGLRLLGETFPSDPAEAPATIADQQREIAQALGQRAIADLVDAPLLSDPVVKGVIELLVDAFSATLLANSHLYPLFVQRATVLSLRHGHGEEASLAYGYYARVPVLADDFRGGYEWSDLALRLDERMGQAKYRGRLLLAQCFFTLPWQKPFWSGVTALEDALVACLQVGNLLHAGYIVHTMQQYLLECGSLDLLLDHSRRYKAMLRQSSHDTPREVSNGWEHLARSLKGLTGSPHELDDESFDEARHIGFLEKGSHALGLFGFFVIKQVVTYLAGRHDESVEWARRAQVHLVAALGVPMEASHRLFHALALAALQGCGTGAAQDQRLRALQAELAVIAKWSAACPENFAARHALLAGELARIEGRALDAERSYEQAIAAARSHGFMHIEAISYERAAAFWRERGFEKFADAYLHEARERYSRWGAQTKVRLIDEQHSSLHEVPAGMPHLDTLAVVKASQALSSRIDLDELIEELLNIAVENAGAQSGQLYFVEEDELVLSAVAEVQGEQLKVHVLHARPAKCQLRPDAILNFVRRSHERVLLDDGAQPCPFSNDEYVQHFRPKSVLCLPLLRRTELFGVLYLENNLSTHAFTTKHVTVLSLLASQAAISLETARLYTALKKESAERQRAEEVSRERQARIERLVESNIIGIRFANLDGRITEANDAFLKIVGYTREDLARGGVNHKAITPAEYQDADERARVELTTRGSYTPYEKEYLRKDGTRVPVLVGGTLFDDSHGAPTQSVVFVLDLTERRRAEAERQARRSAELADQAKSQFLAAMSHELRTPLNGILGYAQLLGMDSELTQRQRRGINTIRESGDHLLSLINDILDLSRIEAGRIELCPTAVDLVAFFRSVADFMRVKADQKDLILAFDAAQDLPAMVMVDERRLRQVLLNLLGNAVKFTDSGTVSLSVRSEPSNEGSNLLRIEVCDTGIGINADDLPSIFEPFEQVGEIKRREAGTGLGLTITRALINAMRGEIAVTSEPGRGTRFSIRLLVESTDSSASRRSGQARPASYDGPRRRILIIDDVAQNRLLLTDFLAAAGFDSQEAQDGLEGLNKARVFRPDLIVMDSVMPVMSGLEATRLLREDPQFAGLPIIAVSATATEEHRQKCFDAGASLYLSKPVRLGELVAAIGQLLQLDLHFS